MKITLYQLSKSVDIKDFLFQNKHQATTFHQGVRIYVQIHLFFSYPLTVLLIIRTIVFLKDETADAIRKNYSLYMRTIMTYSCADSFEAKDI